jgi:hypothetical protein
MLLAASSALAKTKATRGHGRENAADRLQRMIDDMTTRLSINRAVTVSLVPNNPHVVSVEAPTADGGPFVVAVEERVLQLLTEDELEAALAHELGHVWVFTHHPFLQTEVLANRVATRIVTREALARVYEKIWKRDGMKGDLGRFLDQ